MTEPANTSGPLLTFTQGQLLRGGEPHRILAGAIHYFRVHPKLWRDRIRRLVAMGANTLDTYVVWNAHQPDRDAEPDFTGWLDIGRFIDIAAEEGLDVIVRPGPFICAEWDNGGLPAWLTAIPGVRVRTPDPRYTGEVERWFDALLPHIVSRQAAHGGPVVAVQIENEYGSFGDDHEYMAIQRDILLARGVTERLFTADGGTDFFLDGGPLPDVWATATLGSRGDEAVQTWQRRRPGEPFLAAEFWGGWFDHWGEKHHVRDAEDAAAEVAKILDRGGSVCIYMAHGGTNFGLRSGANHHGARIEPTITSYDSDAPIAEDGSLTAKFHALRRQFHRARGVEPPPLPEDLVAPNRVLPARTLPLRPGAPLLDILAASGEPVESREPLSFEQLGLDAGLVLYEADPVLPGRDGVPQESQLRIPGLADRALIWIDGTFVGALDDANALEGITVTGHGRPVLLQIVVENLGRINYGWWVGRGKGILDGVLVNQRRTSYWRQIPVPLDRWTEQQLAPLAHAEFEVDGPADTHLALPGSRKGFAWINGFLLGRYWERGPQRTLYVPAPLLHPGRNEVRVLELERLGKRVELNQRMDLGPVDRDPIDAAELP